MKSFIQKTRELVNMRNIVLLSTLLTVAAVFYSCKEDEPEPDPKPQDPVTTTFNLSTADITEAKATEINQKIAANKLPNKVIVKVTGNLGITGSNKHFMNYITAWSKETARGVTLDVGSFFAYPAEKTFLTPDDLKWIKNPMNIGANPTTGEKFYVLLANQMVFIEAGLGDVVQPDMTGYEGYDIAANISDLVPKINEAKSQLDKGNKVKFALVGVCNFTNAHTNALEDNFLGRDGLTLNSKDAIVGAGADSVRVNRPDVFADSFENFIVTKYDDDKYFYVPGGAAGKMKLVERVGIASTDSTYATSGNLEKGLIPREWIIDEDLYKCAGINKDISKYTKVITITSLSDSKAPGGFKRVYSDFNPELYSTPESRKAGEGRRVFQFVVNPVIGPYNTITGQLYIDYLTGKDVKIDDNSIYTYESGYGNCLVDKMVGSNNAVDKWTASKGIQELFPVLADPNKGIVYDLKYPANDDNYRWTQPTVAWGNPANGNVLVSLKTVKADLDGVFKLRDRDKNGADTGNALFYVNLSGINFVFPDSLINAIQEEAKLTGENTYTLYGKAILDALWLKNPTGVQFMPESLIKQYGKKAH